jgi:hypothetical protein
MKRPSETYQAARRRLLAHLVLTGWSVRPTLKVPNARKDGETLFFHAQAVYLNAHSLWIDIRDMSEASFDAAVNARIEGNNSRHGS